MSGARKLQTEIDKTLKKVDEGVEVFDEIWEKVYSASQQNQKEKYEMDLKKEIKKLQRLRDQIKSWISSSDIKDKKPLTDARKLIEVKMEQFKVCEKETKTKTYSKEGLARAAKLDPEEQAKQNSMNYLQDAIERLSVQVEAAEAEVEKLSNSKNAKKHRGEIEEKETSIRRHRWHMSKMEQIIRMIDNDARPADCIDEIKEEIEFYIDSNGDPEFMDSYGDVDPYEVLELDDVPSIAVDMAAAASSSSSKGRDDVDEKPDKAEKKKEKKEKKKSSSASSSLITIGRAKVVKKDEKEKSPTKTAPGLPKPTPSPTPVPPRPPMGTGESLASILKGGDAAHAKQQAGQAKQAELAKQMEQAKHHQQQMLLQQQQQQQQKQQQQQRLLEQQRRQQEQLQANQVQAQGRGGGAVPGAPGMPGIMHGSAEDHAQGGLKGLASGSPSSVGGAFGSPSMDPSGSPHLLASPALAPHLEAPPGVLMGEPSSTLDAVGALSGVGGASAGGAGSGGSAAVGVEGPEGASASASLDQSSSLAALEASMRSMPTNHDRDRVKPYTPRNPYQVPERFFGPVPSPIFEDPAIFEKFQADTLFFIFYYQQGSYQQYLAAKELKKHSWRFHKKYKTWFQRHEEPKLTTEELEQGTYVYFDYQGTYELKSGWCQRIKYDFTFEYEYLEDELN